MGVPLRDGGSGDPSAAFEVSFGKDPTETAYASKRNSSSSYGRTRLFQVLSQGELWEELIFSENLLIANTGTKPTFESTTSQSIIDITLSNDTQLVNCWTTTDIDNDSDHKIIK